MVANYDVRRNGDSPDHYKRLGKGRNYTIPQTYSKISSYISGEVQRNCPIDRFRSTRTKKAEAESVIKMEVSRKQESLKVPFYELPLIANHGTIRTFQRRIYEIKGIVVKDVATGKLERLQNIYYEIRTVKNKKGRVVAKRKNPTDELIRVVKRN